MIVASAHAHLPAIEIMHYDKFLTKVPGLVSEDGVTNAYCPYRWLAEMNYKLLKFIQYE